MSQDKSSLPFDRATVGSAQNSGAVSTETSAVTLIAHAELNDIEVGPDTYTIASLYNARSATGRETHQYLFLGGTDEHGHVCVHVYNAKSPEVPKKNDGLIALDATTIQNMDAAKIGEITLQPRCRPEQLIEAIVEQLRDHRELGYAMRFAAISQYGMDEKTAHKTATDIASTTIYLIGKNGVNRVDYDLQKDCALSHPQSTASTFESGAP